MFLKEVWGKCLKSEYIQHSTFKCVGRSLDLIIEGLLRCVGKCVCGEKEILSEVEKWLLLIV